MQLKSCQNINTLDNNSIIQFNSKPQKLIKQLSAPNSINIKPIQVVSPEKKFTHLSNKTNDSILLIKKVG